jgi:hypothetical protein
MPFFSYGGFLQVRPTRFQNSGSGNCVFKEQRLRKKTPPPFLPPHPPPIPQPARKPLSYLQRSNKQHRRFFLFFTWKNNDVVFFLIKIPAADFVTAAKD